MEMKAFESDRVWEVTWSKLQRPLVYFSRIAEQLQTFRCVPIIKPSNYPLRDFKITQNVTELDFRQSKARILWANTSI